MVTVPGKIACFALVMGIAGYLLSCSKVTNTATSSLATPVIYGYLYKSDGTAATNAKVTLVKADNVPANQSAKKAASATDGLTDAQGRFTFSNIQPATYNIYGEIDSTVSYYPQVYISSTHKDTCIAKDTLFAPGIITGSVKLFPVSDNRKMLILILGSNRLLWPDDSSGNFTIKNLAKGTYTIRFLPTDPSYPIVDTAFTVKSGQTTTVGKICIGQPTVADTVHRDSLTVSQRAFLALKFGAILHFNMSTFARYQYPTPSGEWELGGESENLFNPQNLNCGQWADAVKSAGCTYAVLTVKHVGGFCLWNSSATTHDVGSSSWGLGKRDVVREFVDSTRIRGLKVGFYYSIWDRTTPITIQTIKTQLTELLTNYGPISHIFFDGWGWRIGYSAIPYETVNNFVKSLQPNCLVLENNHRFTLFNTEIAPYEIPIDGLPLTGNSIPAEAFEPIRADGSWFWHPDGGAIKSAQFIIDRLVQCNPNNANYLINLAPDTTGRLPQSQVERLKEIGALYSKTQIPPAPSAPNFIGTWSNYQTRQNGGAAFPDTFGVALTINPTGYILVRGNSVYGSSAMIFDSSKVFGTWEKNVYGDSIVTQIDSCFRYNSGSNSWHACNGIAPYYDECPTPIALKISIYNNIWTAQIPTLGDEQEIFTYSLTKQ